MRVVGGASLCGYSGRHQRALPLTGDGRLVGRTIVRQVIWQAMEAETRAAQVRKGGFILRHVGLPSVGIILGQAVIR